jgi:crossover junction endodeoxyribonuclease RuvC
MNPMRVLGIDPSLRSTGFGVVEAEANRYLPVVFGIIRPAAAPLHHQLEEIRTEVAKLIAGYAPEEVVVESPFFARNARTAFVLGQVRGAVLAAVAASGRPLFEYSPLEIKKAVTGYGHADKGQVQTMVRALLNLADDALSNDASDALAATICHLNARLFNARLEEA